MLNLSVLLNRCKPQAERASGQTCMPQTPNVLKTTAVPLTGHFAHGVGLVMKKAPATEGVLGGHALYGVRSSGSWLHKCARSWSHLL